MSHLPKDDNEFYSFENSPDLYHDESTNSIALGCTSCAYKSMCGGLAIKANIFDCQTFCRCKNPSLCDNVCPKNPKHMAARSQEVNGFNLNGLPVLPDPKIESFDWHAPMIFHKSKREKAACAPTICLSLYQIFNRRNGVIKFQTRNQLISKFGLRPDAKIILSGTQKDRVIERWWGHLTRPNLAKHLNKLGINLVTTPNYSSFNDVPRLDNLYNMKRIVLSWHEIQKFGTLCAPHLNGRTDHDWDQWLLFLLEHKEIKYIAFEFGTGARTPNRMSWYIKKLQDLSVNIKRPIGLIIRGGITSIQELVNYYDKLVYIDTSSFVKAQRRQKAMIRQDKLEWVNSPTLEGEPIDDLFENNIKANKIFLKNKGLKSNLTHHAS